MKFLIQDCFTFAELDEEEITEAGFDDSFFFELFELIKTIEIEVFMVFTSSGGAGHKTAAKNVFEHYLASLSNKLGSIIDSQISPAGVAIQYHSSHRQRFIKHVMTKIAANKQKFWHEIDVMRWMISPMQQHSKKDFILKAFRYYHHDPVTDLLKQAIKQTIQTPTESLVGGKLRFLKGIVSYNILPGLEYLSFAELIEAWFIYRGNNYAEILDFIIELTDNFPAELQRELITVVETIKQKYIAKNITTSLNAGELGSFMWNILKSKAKIAELNRFIDLIPENRKTFSKVFYDQTMAVLNQSDYQPSKIIITQPQMIDMILTAAKEFNSNLSVQIIFTDVPGRFCKAFNDSLKYLNKQLLMGFKEVEFFMPFLTTVTDYTALLKLITRELRDYPLVKEKLLADGLVEVQDQRKFSCGHLAETMTAPREPKIKLLITDGVIDKVFLAPIPNDDMNILAEQLVSSSELLQDLQNYSKFKDQTTVSLISAGSSPPIAEVMSIIQRNFIETGLVGPNILYVLAGRNYDKVNAQVMALFNKSSIPADLKIIVLPFMELSIVAKLCILSNRLIISASGQTILEARAAAYQHKNLTGVIPEIKIISFADDPNSELANIYWERGNADALARELNYGQLSGQHPVVTYIPAVPNREKLTRGCK